jgi:hypothetical protein
MVTLEYVVLVMKSDIPICCGILGFNSVLQSDQSECCGYGSSVFIPNIGTQLPGAYHFIRMDDHEVKLHCSEDLRCFAASALPN